MTQLAISEYGTENGQLLVYFHGVPGAIDECAVFDSHAKRHNLRVICFDRFAVDCSNDRESYYQQLVDRVVLEAGGEPVNLVGFSIGAHVALEVGKRLGASARSTHLISAAAPLGAGDFLDNMAGGLVFTLARDRPLVFSFLTGFQSFLAYLAPGLLFRMLFSSATGKDESLCKSREFKRKITGELKHCFRRHVRGYMRDVGFYVNWQGEFTAHASCVELWHGTEDNWSPISMATYLCNAIPGATRVRTMDGLSHYSCLYEVAPRICESLECLTKEQIG